MVPNNGNGAKRRPGNGCDKSCETPGTQAVYAAAVIVVCRSRARTSPGREDGPAVNTFSAVDVARVCGPGVTAEELRALAAERPDLHPLIAENPATYPELVDWLGSLGDPEVDAAIARRFVPESRAAFEAAVDRALAGDQASASGVEVVDDTVVRAAGPVQPAPGLVWGGAPDPAAVFPGEHGSGGAWAPGAAGPGVGAAAGSAAHVQAQPTAAAKGGGRRGLIILAAIGAVALAVVAGLAVFSLVGDTGGTDGSGAAGVDAASGAATGDSSVESGASGAQATPVYDSALAGLDGLAASSCTNAPGDAAVVDAFVRASETSSAPSSGAVTADLVNALERFVARCGEDHVARVVARTAPGGSAAVSAALAQYSGGATLPPSEPADYILVDTPTRNISCEVYADHVGCSIAERSYEPAEDCPTSLYSLTVDQSGLVQRTCFEEYLGQTGDTVRHMGYGESVVNGSMRCDLAENGMVCLAPNGQGFKLSRHGLTVY